MAIDEEKLLIARLEELARRAATRWEPTFTLFLDPSQMELAHRAARTADAELEFQGGYEDAERRIVSFFPQGWPEPLAWPMAAMVIRWNSRFSHAGHRDILGSLMALGFKREVLGDILVFDDHAICFAHESIAD